MFVAVGNSSQFTHKGHLRRCHHNHREGVLSRLMLVGMKVAFDLRTDQSHTGPSCLLPDLLVPKGMVCVTLGLPELQGLGACCGICRI